MHTTHRRLPRAGIDRIDSAASALATIAHVVTRPMRAETIVLALDDARCGRAIVVVAGTHRPDDVIEVVECVARAAVRPDALVVASIRPDRWLDLVDTDGRTDLDRWLEMSEVGESVGVEVVEWFVVGRSITCPRDVLGEPPRW